VVPVGGGGLISGIATALKALLPSVVLVGVEPKGSDVVSQSLAAGQPISLERFQTVADGLNAPWSAPTSFAIIHNSQFSLIVTLAWPGPAQQSARA
jgi:threonine dehydratase